MTVPISHRYAYDNDLLEAVRSDGKPRVRVYRLAGTAVVLGAGSRPEVELHLEACLADGVPVLRRRGVAPSDLFWREVRRVPVLADPGEWDAHTDPPVIAIRREGNEEAVWCGIKPDDFMDGRQIAKTTRLLAVLLRTGSARPDLTASELLVGQPDSPFVRRSLDFNPYKYRRW